MLRRLARRVAAPFRAASVPMAGVPPPRIELLDANTAGPLSYLLSPFALVLLAVSLLNNRIRVLVPPVDRPSSRLSPTLQLALRLPSLLLMLRAMLCLAVALADGMGYELGDGPISRIVLPGFNASRAEEAASILWRVFVSTATAVVTETFIRALNDDMHGQRPFNILSLSYLLHIRSIEKAQDSLSPHLIVHLLLVLSELCILNTSYSFSNRFEATLAITATFSIASQACMLLSVFNLISKRSSVEVYAWNCLPELLFELLAALSIGLKVLAAVIRGEKLTKEKVFGHESCYPQPHEDYTLAIVKYGMSCLETSRLSALSNEVDPIAARYLSYVPFASESRERIPAVKLSRGARVEIAERELEESEMVRLGGRQHGHGQGLGREIFAVDAVVRERPPDAMLRHPDRNNTIWRFALLCCKIALYLSYRSYVRARATFRPVLRYFGILDGVELNQTWGVKKEEEANETDEDYLEGSESSSDGSDDEGSASEDDFHPHVLYADLAQPAASLGSTSAAVVKRSESDDDTQTSIMLAHHTASSSSPLTRRRYRAILQPRTVDSDMETMSAALIEQVRRDRYERGAGRIEHDDGQQRLCVVCYTEERTIINWPCRCLALCEDCREGLAKRTSSKTLCPCCRTEITGYSRIFIP